MDKWLFSVDKWGKVVDNMIVRQAHYKRGQSLVEMAVIAPLLIFIFIGLTEVGWAMRGYMILLQGTREAARFAVRGDLRDLWWTGRDDKAKQLVFQHFLDTTNLPFVENRGTFILHRYDVFTGRVCLMQLKRTF